MHHGIDATDWTASRTAVTIAIVAPEFLPSGIGPAFGCIYPVTRAEACGRRPAPRRQEDPQCSVEHS
jgi:hypothetical protein